MRKEKVCCFGEILLRLAPDGAAHWLKDFSMSAYIGGAEFNVAAALAQWGLPVKYVTVMPDNYFSKSVLDYIDQKKIDNKSILLSGERIGIYYLPIGLDLKNTGVIYDRAHSSFSGIKTGMIDWEKIFSDCTWFHFSAISPALNQNVADVCLEALEAASRKGITISIDLNYRSKLWQYTRDTPSVMKNLAQHCDIVMGNIWAVEQLLGIPSPIDTSIGKSKEQLASAAAENILQLQKEFPKPKSFAYTFRLEDQYWAALHHQGKLYLSGQYPLPAFVDKVGSGDCFMGGLIYGLYNEEIPQNIIDFSAAAAVGKLQEAGDITGQMVADIRQKVISN
jgi:2-dehydro-3-deoxygluconokinase